MSNQFSQEYLNAVVAKVNEMAVQGKSAGGIAVFVQCALASTESLRPTAEEAKAIIESLKGAG